MAETVYWLAVAERSLQYRFFDSLSRHYLQRCVRQFPEHPAVARCLEEYERLMVVSYAGSNGVSLPEPVRAELVEMRQLLNDARKRDASVR